MKRPQIAQFLLGFFALPVCALLGGMEALMMHLHSTGYVISVAFFCLFPLAGALKSRQKILALGLITGAAASLAAYLALRPH